MTRPDTISIEPLDATLGARVTGVRLGALDDAGFRTIEDAFHQHAVLVFPVQHLGEAEQIAFGRRFGALETIGPVEGMVAIANTSPDGTLRPSSDPVAGILKGNEGWHTDSSYMPVSAKASILSAHVVPARGGETEFADMRAAYDALAPARRDEIQGLAAYHSLTFSQRRVGQAAPAGFYGIHDGPDPLRPLVKVHPVTGRPALYIGRHAYGIPGLDPADSKRLLDDLLAFACQPPRVYRHHWTVGDVVMWDNRCVLHRARTESVDEPRLMKHTRVSGDPATESALAPA